MHLSEYQKLAARTLIDEPDHEITQKQWDMVTTVHNLARRAVAVESVHAAANGRRDMVLWNITGLLGEVGELIDVVKKDIFHQHPTDTSVYLKKVGDIMWYWAACCTVAGLEAQSVAVLENSSQVFALTLAIFWRQLAFFVETFMPFTLEEAGEHNNAKLKQRYPNGFDPADSLKRVDVA